MSNRRFPLRTIVGRWAPVVLAAALGGCQSVEDPVAEAPVGGRTIVYGRITDAQGAGLTNVRVTVRHHTALCAGRINETESVQTSADGRYRAVLTAVTSIGCVSVRAQAVSANALGIDSVMNVRAPFRQREPLDSVAVNLTLRGGIQ